MDTLELFLTVLIVGACGTAAIIFVGNYVNARLAARANRN